MKGKQINGCPVYNVVMADGTCRMLRVSLVDLPAVESDFVRYASVKEQNYAVSDEEHRRVFGVVLRADYPIYRIAPNGEEFYVIFRADQIRAYAQKYLAEGRQNKVDLEHDLQEIEGAELVQYFLKDTAKGVAPTGFDNVADGSLFAEYQITDDALWGRIKSGEFHGFSVEIVQGMELIPEEMNQNTTMSKIEKLKEMLAKCVSILDESQYGSVSTDKGAIVWDGDEDLKAGMKVFGENAEGQRIDLEDGDYLTDDQKIIAVAGGEVKEIRDREAEVAPAEAPAPEPQQMEGEPEPTAEPAPVSDEKDLKIAELEAVIEGLKKELEEAKAKLNEPAGEPAHEAFKKAKKLNCSVNPFDELKTFIKR